MSSQWFSPNDGALSWAPPAGGSVPKAAPPTKPIASSSVFKFTAFNPDVLNCTVIGPNNRPAFQISNNVPSPGITLFQDALNRSVAVVEWREKPGTIVEIRDVVMRTTAAQWLQLAPDRSHRRMEFNGIPFLWSPRDDAICLYALEKGAMKIYALINRSHGSIILELTAEAMEKGLLVICVVSVILLQSGRKID